MAETGSYSPLGFRLDVKQILSEAHHRWLRPAEICEILRNYKKFHISPESPTKPISGSVFLFDRKVLRYFRKDSHNWRKKKDGKTIKEAHEKLKVGSVDMLHCYYAHGEDNENFQRRCYWLLEQDLMHIVFVHYLEVKGNKASMNYPRNTDSVVSHSGNDSSMSSSFHETSPTSTLSSAQEDAESEGNHQASSRFHSYPESPLTDGSRSTQSSSYNLISTLGGQNVSALNNAPFSEENRYGNFGGGSSISGPQDTVNLAAWQEILEDRDTGDNVYKPELSSLPIQANWQHSFGDHSFPLDSHNLNQNLVFSSPNGHGNNLFDEKFLLSNQGNDMDPFYPIPEQRNLQTLLSGAETGTSTNPNMVNGMIIENENYSCLLKKPLISGLQTGESLKKVDSFSRWMANELEDGGELNMLSSTGMTWSMMGNEYDSSMPAQLQADTHTLNPSLSQDQLFSIIEFSPNWVYSDLETKVLIAGKFLKSEEELSIYRWSIMFGEVEVPAEVLADGILCCHAPLHKPGLVPFYVTCSNRLACSEIREFEYRYESDRNTAPVNVIGASAIMMHLYQRFETILSLEPVGSPVSGNDLAKQSVLNKIMTLMDENYETKPTSNADMSQLMIIGEMLLEKQLKDKFYSWLFQRVTDDGKGLTITDESGQNVLHLAAAGGFNWALQPIMVSGVSIDFRDVNGWTALHWAAFYGREDTVAALVSLRAAPGALTDPSAEYPLGRTPADLASCSGHKGISGFLAETSLTTHLTTLRVNEDSTPEVSAIQTVSERLAIPTTEADVPDTLSLKDSLAAVCNATQAAAQIHQIFRIQSFQRKQFVEEEGDELPTPEEHAISLVAGKTSRLSRSTGMANAAAVQIQKKYRGWKKRKEFLLIRQKIVKIQAHVRGHQVRKKYKPIIWSVGILEKVILRWRRKGSGLRGFRSDVLPQGTQIQEAVAQEDDYDFLREGRKQAEERMQKALTRVKSMAQYPEARAQYRRLLTAAEEFRETKESADVIPDNFDNFEDMIYPEEDLIDIASLLDDDTFMSLTFE